MDHVTGVGTLDADLASLDDVPVLPPEEGRAVLRRLLRNPDPAVRHPAIDLAAAILTDEDIVTLLREGGEDGLRNSAAAVLRLRGADGITLALRLLRDDDADVVLQAVLVLDASGTDRAEGALRQLLSHPNTNVVQAAIVAIGHLGYRGAIDDLLPMVGGDIWLQAAVVEALGDLRAGVAVPALAAILGKPVLGSLAGEALVRIGGTESLRILVSEWLDRQPRDAGRLAQIATLLETSLADEAATFPAFSAALPEALALGPAHALAAARCLLAMGPGPHDAAALDALEDAQPFEPPLPAALARRGDLIPHLVRDHGARARWGWLLADRYPGDISDDTLRHMLAQPMGGHEGDGLVAALESRSDPALGELVLAHFLALPRIIQPRWGRVLRQYRGGIRAALDRRRDLPADDRLSLIALLEDDPAAVCDVIAQLSGQARARLIAQTLDRAAVLERLPWLQWLEEDVDLYGPLALGAAERGALSRLQPPIRELLARHPTPHLIRLVTRLGDRSSVPLLISLLDRDDADLRPFLLDALGTFGDAEARAALRDQVQRGNDRWERWAFRALAQCGTPEDAPIFRAAAGHPDWHVRLSCVEGLTRSGQAEDRQIVRRLMSDPVRTVADRARELVDGTQEPEPSR